MLHHKCITFLDEVVHAILIVHHRSFSPFRLRTSCAMRIFLCFNRFIPYQIADRYSVHRANLKMHRRYKIAANILHEKKKTHTKKKHSILTSFRHPYV